MWWMAKRTSKRHYLREWREHRGLSLARLAARMIDQTGEEIISSVSIGRIERGQQPYSQPILEALADALQCSAEDLLAVNPLKDGEVVDLMRLIREMDDAKRRQLLKIGRALA
jgi:transcriptional regulator with XRE-family HTH domain